MSQAYNATLSRREITVALSLISKDPQCTRDTLRALGESEWEYLQQRVSYRDRWNSLICE